MSGRFGRLVVLVAAGVLGAAALAGCAHDDDTSAAPELTQTGMTPSLVRPPDPVGAGARRFCGTLQLAGDYPRLSLEVVRGGVGCGEARRVLAAHYEASAGRAWSCGGPQGFVECERPGAVIRARFLCLHWYPRDWNACVRTFGPR
jgi:hypothetical protein